MASEIGRLRQLSSVRHGRKDQHGFKGEGWNEHIEGACGELAVAKALNLYWNGSIDTFKENDLPGLQIRTRSKHDYDLIVRPDDSNESKWVLVTGRCPEYDVRGWIQGIDAKKPEWQQTYGNRPAAFFVPAAALNPIETIIEVIK